MQHKYNYRKNRKLKAKSWVLTTLVICTFSSSTIKAQESLNTTGGNASGTEGSVSYSVGQIACQSHTGTNGSVSKGVQQPYEISTVAVIKKAKGINLSVSAYPNPATDYLVLNIESKKLKGLSYQLLDFNGKLLQNKNLTGSKTEINISNYAPATYFIRILCKNQPVKEFKIIKK